MYPILIPPTTLLILNMPNSNRNMSRHQEKEGFRVVQTWGLFEKKNNLVILSIHSKEGWVTFFTLLKVNLTLFFPTSDSSSRDGGRSGAFACWAFS